MREKACEECRRIVEEGDECPVCKSKDLSSSWKSLLIVYDPENSEMAEEADISSPGRYAIRVR